MRRRTIQQELSSTHPQWVSIPGNRTEQDPKTFSRPGVGPIYTTNAKRLNNIAGGYHTSAFYASTAEVVSALPKARNWMKMVTSSTMVPREPINQGRLMSRYSFSWEWKRICVTLAQTFAKSVFLKSDSPLHHMLHCPVDSG
jgi:hypothetical protein